MMDAQQSTGPAGGGSPLLDDALLSAKTCAAALEISESTWWAWVSDPQFPVQPVRHGERFTRFRRSQFSAWMTALGAGEAKEAPNRRRKSQQAPAGRGAQSA